MPFSRTFRGLYEHRALHRHFGTKHRCAYEQPNDRQHVQTWAGMLHLSYINYNTFKRLNFAQLARKHWDSVVRNIQRPKTSQARYFDGNAMQTISWKPHQHILITVRIQQYKWNIQLGGQDRSVILSVQIVSWKDFRVTNFIHGMRVLTVKFHLTIIMINFYKSKSKHALWNSLTVRVYCITRDMNVLLSLLSAALVLASRREALIKLES